MPRDDQSQQNPQVVERAAVAVMKAYTWVSNLLAHAYVNVATPYQWTIPDIEQTATGQEHDTTYSPHGFRHREYRNYLELRAAGLLLAGISVTVLLTIIHAVFPGPLALRDAVVLAALPLWVLGLGLGIGLFQTTASYPNSRRLNR